MNKKWKTVLIIVSTIAMLVIGLIIVLPYIKPVEVKGIFLPYKYEVYGDYVEIDKYTGDSERIRIPERIWGRKVTVIGIGAFSENTKIEKVVIGDNVEMIHIAAFEDCTNLREVELPEELIVIHRGAFRNCSALEGVELPAQLKVIGSGAFEACSSLNSIQFPESVEYIERWAFGDCTNLQYVDIPESIPRIESEVFRGTKWMEQQTDDFVIAGDGVLIAYQGEDKVVNIPDGVKAFGAVFDEKAENIDRIVIPESVQIVYWDRIDLSHYIEKMSIEVLIENDEIVLERNCIEGMIIIAREDSAGHQYAQEYGEEWIKLE